MKEQDWEFLLERIDNGKCTPFIGPSINEGLIYARSELAESWASEHKYPLTGNDRLARVTQYLSVKKYEFFPNDQIGKEISNADIPDFTSLDQLHGLLADLNLPLYVTTNYDDFMFQALRQRKRKPERGIYRWNRLLVNRLEELPPDYLPDPATPLVYHLHGYLEFPESLVLREDDYLDFLVHISGSEYKLPPPVLKAMSDTSLLFIGYNPSDWEFRVLLRGLIKRTDAPMRRISVNAQFPLSPETPKEIRQNAKEYLSKYFSEIDREMRLYWGTSKDFLVELNRRRLSIHTNKSSQKTENTQRIDQIGLFHKLEVYFNLDGLHDLAFELGIDKDNLPTRKKSFARELIQNLKKQQRLHELVELCRRERPNIEW